MSVPRDHIYFNVYIDSSNVLPDFDLSKKNSDFWGIAYYEDFVTALTIHGKLSVSISPIYL